jgi:hypothetical protein
MLDLIKKITDIDFFKEGQNEDLFVGRPYSINYNKANLLIQILETQSKRNTTRFFFLAFYDNPFEENIKKLYSFEF